MNGRKTEATARAREHEGQSPSPALPAASGHEAGPIHAGLGLQRAIGNRAVANLLHPGPGDWLQSVRTTLGRPGQPLDPRVRALMEARLGADFSQVRVHADAQAAASARSVDALAYTVAPHIAFAAGQYQPDTAEGRKLLAHELTHIVQQRPAEAATALQTPPTVLDDAGEQEADAVASSLVGPTTHRLRPRIQAQRPAPVLQRQVLTFPQIRQQIKAKKQPEINEIVDALPTVMFDSKPHKIKEATLNGTKHVWELTITPIPDKPSGSDAAVTIPGNTRTTEAQGKQTIHHPIFMSIHQTIPNAVETLFHELIHVRLLVDSDLPPDQRSATYREYAQIREMASGPLAIVLGTQPNREAVLTGIRKVRAFFRVFVKGWDDDKVPERLKEDTLYEFLINEKFTNQRAATAFGRTETNAAIARRYADAIASQFQIVAQDQGLYQQFAAVRSNGKLDEATDDLTKATTGLYDMLDTWKAKAEATKTQQPPAAPPEKGTTDQQWLNPPLDLTGKPIYPKS